MENKKGNDEYIFYLEPYTFLFKGAKGIVLYNTLNSVYINYTQEPEVQEFLDKLYNSNEGYCISIPDIEILSKEFLLFLSAVRDSFSGDIISKDELSRIPFIFKPHLRLYSNPNDLKIKEEHLLGLNILHYLNEVSFYLGAGCSFKCENCFDYYKQFSHCTKTGPQILNLNDYLIILDQLELCHIAKINLIVGNEVDNLYIDLLNIMNRYSFKKELIITLDLLKLANLQIDNVVQSSNFSLKIMNHAPFVINDIRDQIRKYNRYNATWTFIISNEEDSKIVDELVNEEDLIIEILPYFNGANINFFEKYVYNTLDDILKIPVNKQTIFRREVLNENFFGNLAIFPEGNVYSNVNYPQIGNVKINKLSEIVFNELNSSKSWLKVRNNTECVNCTNKYLCPSISNYEIVLNRFNLCHI